jgi:hypothetical protein
VNKIFLLSEPLIDQLEGKNGSIWRIGKRTSSEELSDQSCVKLSQIIRLNPFSIKGNSLNVKLPSGRWRIVRIGHTSTGHKNETGGGGKGLECDKFSKDAVNLQLENWFGAVFKNTDSLLARRVLKFMHVDSWECGSQNWSDNFLEEFKRKRGYDLEPYLLVYTGIPVESLETTESILSDIRETIAELVVDVFYQTVAEFAKKYDCRISAESVAPTMVSDGMLHYKMVDRPMGEFWLQSPTHDKFNDMLDAISGAHIYGKNIIQAEGFTQLRIMWNETPRMLKPLLDRNYALGMNKLFNHVFVHNPYLNKAPGVTLDGIGTFLQRDQLWWKYGKGWSDYIYRCQTLLQFGHPVVDIAVFTGEETPRRAILPDRLINSLPGIFGEEKLNNEKKRLINEGQPLRTMPVGVNHSAHITDAGDWIDALHGYAYDSFNRDALLHLARVRNGRLVLPGGMSYKMLILPEPYSMSPDSDYMSMEIAEKIKEWQDQGLIILLGHKPNRIPGFSKNGRLAKNLKEVAEKIWNVSPNFLLPYQQKDFSQFGLERDIDFDGQKEIAWAHRADENVDIYFISNQKSENRNINISFRCVGRIPEVWNPVTGEIYEANEWNMKNGRTYIRLQLFENQSLFVVFKKNTDRVFSRKTVSTLDVESLTENTWNITFVNDTLLKLKQSPLFDWSKHNDNNIRYYSGEAIYETNFKVDRVFVDKNIFLNLGKVYDLAKVFVNDVDCGIVWIFPDRINITHALKTGNNTLKIKIINTWMNKVIGIHENKVKDETFWTNAPYRLEGQPLQPSGLLGPLSIEYERIE